MGPISPPKSTSITPPEHEGQHRYAPTIARSIVAALVLMLAIVGGAAPATAGGWAIGTLDSIPAPTAGTSVDVGFTILQHGVTPADLDEGVAITVTEADGTDHSFEAVGEGAPGHYVATVTFPDDPGTYEWSLDMGWFGPQDLGSITVDSAPDTVSTSSATMWPAIRWVVLTIAVALAAIVMTDVVRSRHRARANAS